LIWFDLKTIIRAGQVIMRAVCPVMLLASSFSRGNHYKRSCQTKGRGRRWAWL